MIPRYTHKEMGAIWSDARRYETWLDVELAATDALAAIGVVPTADASALRERAAFDIDRIEEIERTTQHDVIAFTTAVAEKAGPVARWLHCRPCRRTSAHADDGPYARRPRRAHDVWREAGPVVR
jgi:adenylosuccinate lyase